LGGSLLKEEATSILTQGGIAIVTAFFLAALASGLPLSTFRAFFGGALILVMVGVLDDLRELSPRSRILAQLGAGSLMAVGAGVVVTDLGYLFGPGWLVVLGSMAIPFTLFATTGIMNAINMSDGVDGHSAKVDPMSRTVLPRV
jgi:UDP-N-acetylmuramyl pentapeptide phosphotransferase/UDP-N-acetylglucosamine-1-phosphate transferase